MHFCYRRTIRLKQKNFSCNNKINYTRIHKFITHKKNYCQVFSRSRNDQPLFVNEYKEEWQSSSLKNKFSGFRQAKYQQSHWHLLIESKPYCTTSYEHVSILTFGGLKDSFTFVSASFPLIVNEQISKFSFLVLQKEFSFKLRLCDCL